MQAPLIQAVVVLVDAERRLPLLLLAEGLVRTLR